jgi:hypothetical protein
MIYSEKNKNIRRYYIPILLESDLTSENISTGFNEYEPSFASLGKKESKTRIKATSSIISRG